MTQYQFSELNGHKNLFVLLSDGEPRTITPESHGNFDEILDAVRNGEDVDDLVDVQKAIATRLEPLSDRVSVANGQLYFDGDVLDDVYAKDVVRALNEGSDFGPFVKFLEKVYSNPSFESRSQLTNWLKAQDVTINQDGNIISYKGVLQVDGLDEDGRKVYKSIHKGKAFVNGVEQTGQIRQRVGDRVSMPRSEVDGNGSIDCSTGLHAGSYKFASNFYGGSALLEIEINPIDYVSTPHSGVEKARVCAYRVVGVAEKERTEFVSYEYATPDVDGFEDEEDEIECPYCFDPDCDYDEYGDCDYYGDDENSGWDGRVY